MGEIERVAQIASVPILTQRSGEQSKRRQRDALPSRQDVIEISEEPADDPLAPEPENPVEAPYRLDIAA